MYHTHTHTHTYRDKGQSTVSIKNKKSKGSFKKGKGTKVKSKKSHSAKATGKLSGKLKDAKGRETIKREEGAESTASGSDKITNKKNKVWSQPRLSLVWRGQPLTTPPD